MEFHEVLYSRSSCREYLDKTVEDDVIQKLLEAANAAPVGMGQYDTLHITVIQSAELLAEIDENAARFMGKPEAHPLYGAPVMILISAKLPPAPMESMIYMDAGCIIENIMLDAVNEGLGSCFIMGAVAALNTNEKLMEKLLLPDGMIPVGGCIVGYTETVRTENHFGMDKIITTRL